MQISFEHTHPVHVAEQFRKKRVSDETKETFIGYFTDGMSAGSAKSFHEMKIQVSFDIDEEREEALADASRNPSLRQISWLYENWRNAQFGDRTVSSIVDVLRRKQSEYAELGVTLHIEEDPLVVVILTPIMKRAHEKAFAGDIVFVDSSGSCDQSGSCVTFLFGASKAGGIPLGFVIHQDQTQVNYTSAFEAVKEAVGPSGFGGKGEPSTIMTDDSSEERNGLKAAFPTSVLLLCIFHVCQALWRWLFEKKNGVRTEKRQELMSMFRKVLYAPTEQLCDAAITAVHGSETYKKNISFKNYIDNLFARRADWCLFERRNAVTKGHNTNNIVEASVRIFKDYILERCKAFNAAALVDFISNNLENYHTRRLYSFVNTQNTKPEMQYRRLLKKSVDLEMNSVSERLYKVLSKIVKGKEYEVDVENETCDCPEGIGGKFCKHLCCVHIKADIHLRNLPSIDFQDKADFLYIAKGNAKNIKFYRGMRDNEINEHFSVMSEDKNHPSTSEHESGVGQAGNQVIPPSHCSKEEIRQEFSEIKSASGKMEELCEKVESPSRNLLLDIRRLKKKLMTVNFVAQLHNFCREKGTKSGKMIRVQPTSQSRRVKRAGFSCGAKRIQAGRPSKLEVLLRKTKKRPHNLAKNVQNNVLNARSHSRGM